MSNEGIFGAISALSSLTRHAQHASEQADNIVCAWICQTACRSELFEFLESNNKRKNTCSTSEFESLIYGNRKSCSKST